MVRGLGALQRGGYTERTAVRTVRSGLLGLRLANRLFTDVDHLADLVRRGLGRVQRHPHLLEGTGLAF